MECPLLCVRPRRFVLPRPWSFLIVSDTILLLWLIEWGKGLADNPALGELLNGEVAPLVRMSFRINLVSLVLVAT